jgi:uncharacterized membrane protein YgcG
MAWRFDTGYHFDAVEEAVIEGEMSLEMTFTQIHRPFDSVEIIGEMEVEQESIFAVALDLLRLLPEYYHTKEILMDYVDEVELQVGGWLTSIRDINKLQNPNLVSTRAYLINIANLIGLKIPPEDTSTEDEIRRSISQAIDWYKIKGTYQSVEVIALIQKFTVNLYDMYTNDYVIFYLTDWFVGEENENPPGFDSSYYKSPHFGVEVLLNQVYSSSSGSGASGGSGTISSIILQSGSGSGGASTSHLWQADYLDNFYDGVELTRPVHTVPHYVLNLNPKTDEFQHVIEVDGNIRTRVFSTWQFVTKYFDTDEEFDSDINFDESVTSFIYSITKFVLGTGSGNINSGSWAPVTPVLQGTIDNSDIVIDDNKITFSIIVPRAIAQNGIKELALYTSDDKLVIGSVFPYIDKDSRVELKIKLEVWKESLLG